MHSVLSSNTKEQNEHTFIPRYIMDKMTIISSIS